MSRRRITVDPNPVVCTECKKPWDRLALVTIPGVLRKPTKEELKAQPSALSHPKTMVAFQRMDRLRRKVRLCPDCIKKAVKKYNVEKILADAKKKEKLAAVK